MLSDLLRATRLYTSSYFCNDFVAPWSLEQPKNEADVVVGEALVNTLGQVNPICLSAGDIIAFSTGLAHQVFDESDDNFEHGSDVLLSIKQGHNTIPINGKLTTLLCCHFQYDKKNLLPLLRDIPMTLS